MNLFASCMSSGNDKSYRNNKIDVLHVEDAPSIMVPGEVINPPIAINNGKDNEHNINDVPAATTASISSTKKGGKKFSRMLNAIESSRKESEETNADTNTAFGILETSEDPADNKNEDNINDIPASTTASVRSSKKGGKKFSRMLQAIESSREENGTSNSDTNIASGTGEINDVPAAKGISSITSGEAINPPVAIHFGKDHDDNAIDINDVPATEAVQQSEKEVPATETPSTPTLKSRNKLSQSLSRLVNTLKPSTRSARNVCLEGEQRSQTSILSFFKRRSSNKIAPLQDEVEDQTLHIPPPSKNILRSIHTSGEEQKGVPNWSYHSFCGSYGLGHWSCMSRVSSRTNNVWSEPPSQVRKPKVKEELKNKQVEDLVEKLFAELTSRCYVYEEDMDEEDEIEQVSKVMADIHVNSEAKVEMEVVDL